MAPMMQVTRREVDRPSGFRDVRRNVHTVSFEVDGTTFTAVFDNDEGRVTGPGGELRLTLTGAYSMPGLRRGIEGEAYGDPLALRRPRYGWTKASRVIEVDVAGARFGSVLTHGLTAYELRDPRDEVLADVRGGRLRIREGLVERDVAIGLAVYESNLATTSLFRAFVPGSGPIASLGSRAARPG